MSGACGGTGGRGDPRAESLIAGVDEAGRGPLAGPVVVAAVILDPERPVAGLGDSKRLRAPRREALAGQIREEALAWAIVEVEPREIDAVNILQATLRGMQRAVAALPVAATGARIDGKHCPPLACPAEALVGGDGRDPAIGAASILAKVTRDRRMVELDARWPGYGFAVHKGYPTRAHLEALRRLGPADCHRRSFAPVRAVLDAPELPFGS